MILTSRGMILNEDITLGSLKTPFMRSRKYFCSCAIGLIPHPTFAMTFLFLEMLNFHNGTLTFSVPWRTPYGILRQFYMALASNGLIKSDFLCEN